MTNFQIRLNANEQKIDQNTTIGLSISSHFLMSNIYPKSI